MTMAFVEYIIILAILWPVPFSVSLWKLLLNLQKNPFTFRTLYTTTDDFYTNPVLASTYMTNFL